MEIHELCSILPEIEGEQFDQLKNDIEANGLLNPILIYKGKIIDGKNRYRALQKLNIEPTFNNGMLKKWEGNGSLKGFIKSLNILRRHLNPSQRAAFALDFLEDYQKSAKKRQGERKDLTSDKKLPEVKRSKDIAAKDFGTNRQYINDAEKIKKESPELFKSIKEGKKTISQAKSEIKKTKKVNTVEIKAEKREWVFSWDGYVRSRYNKIGKPLEGSFLCKTLKNAIDSGMKALRGYVSQKKYDLHIWLTIEALIPIDDEGGYNSQKIYSRKYEWKNGELVLLDEKNFDHYINLMKNSIKSKHIEIQFIKNIIDRLLHDYKKEVLKPIEPKKNDYELIEKQKPKKLKGAIIYEYPDGFQKSVKAKASNKEELQKAMKDKMPKDFDIKKGRIYTSGGL